MQLTLRLGCACNVAQSLQFILGYALSFLFLFLLKLVLHRVCSIRCEDTSVSVHTHLHTYTHTHTHLRTHTHFIEPCPRGIVFGLFIQRKS